MPRSIRLAALLTAVCLPALAADRPAWDAELWSMEEGEVLVASVISVEPEGDEIAPTVALMCDGRNAYRLRYDPGPQPDDSTDWTGQSADFEFTVGTTHVERELVFEALDGMWAVTLPQDDELIGLIETGSELTVLMPTGGLTENTFSLKGSSAAIAEIRRSC